MKALLLTNEYPPHIYGGAGVHIDNLSKELAKLCKVNVRCFGNQKVNKVNLKVKGYKAATTKYSAPKELHRVFDAIDRSVQFNADNIDADIVHIHTWYTHYAGIMAKLNYSIPLVLTVHSLEPLRPWKREQLGAGYDFSSWIERTAINIADAVIAVSEDTKKNILKCYKIPEKKVHTISNGVDPKLYKPTKNIKILKKLGINPDKPYVLFVGRITRQKGIIHLLNAIPHINKDCQIVLCASAPDTPKIDKEMRTLIKKIKKTHSGVIWLNRMVEEPTKVVLYSHASVFCCPSVYEPFGIINVEAMACEAPVVASAVGGIKEIIDHGKTGYLVPVKLKSANSFSPINPKKFAQDLARKINVVIKDKKLAIRLGKAGRQRVLAKFTWEKVAKETLALYKKLVK